MRYPNHAIAEIFVEHQGKVDAKSHTENFHCEHGVLYSYSTPIAVWSWRLKELYAHMLLGCSEQTITMPPDVIFLTERRYSQTTSMHEGYLRYSHNGKEMVEFPCEIDALMNSPGETMKLLAEEKETSERKLLRARKDYMKEHWHERLQKIGKVTEILRPVAVMNEIKNGNGR